MEVGATEKPLAGKAGGSEAVRPAGPAGDQNS